MPPTPAPLIVTEPSGFATMLPASAGDPISTCAHCEGGSGPSVQFTLSVALPTLPAASRASTMSGFAPVLRDRLFAHQAAVPEASPYWPFASFQMTLVTAVLSEAVPAR